MALEQYDGETPDLGDLIKRGASSVLDNFYSAIPAKIVSYDKAKQCADVQPLVKIFDADNNAVDMPVVPCCQVFFPAGGGYSFVFPLSAGDQGIVVFSSQSMAQWSVEGDEKADPESKRRGSLSDGVFFPGIRPQSAALAAAQGTGLSLGLDDGTSTITIDNAGLVTVAQTLKVGTGVASATNDTLLQAELAKIAAKFQELAAPPPTPYVPAPTALSNITGD